MVASDDQYVKGLEEVVRKLEAFRLNENDRPRDTLAQLRAMASEATEALDRRPRQGVGEDERGPLCGPEASQLSPEPLTIEAVLAMWRQHAAKAGKEKSHVQIHPVLVERVCASMAELEAENAELRARGDTLQGPCEVMDRRPKVGPPTKEVSAL